MCQLAEEKFHVYEKYVREGAEEGKEVRRGGEGEGRRREGGGRERGCVYDCIPNTTERGGFETGGWSVS